MYLLRSTLKEGIFILHCVVKVKNIEEEDSHEKPSKLKDIGKTSHITNLMHTKVDTFLWKVEIRALKLPQFIQKKNLKLKKPVFISENVFNIMFLFIYCGLQKSLKQKGLQKSFLLNIIQGT